MGEKNADKRLILNISGLVQGVFFRMETAGKAEKMGLRGWVKNMPDGTVRVVAEGDAKMLETFKKWCRKGPEFAKVEKLEENWERATGEFKNFEIT